MNKRGFTLIELLAVIVVLAIIALIATPIVMNLISNAQEGANARSVEGYMKAYEAAYYDYMLKNGGKAPGSDFRIATSDYSGAEVNCDNIAVVNGKFTATCSVVGYDGRYKYENGTATKVGSKTSDNSIVCVAASGDDLTYTYVGNYDESTGSYPQLTGTYTTGNKQVGDAYRCTVGDNLSYVFNILEVKDDTISLLMNTILDDSYITRCPHTGEHECRGEREQAMLEERTRSWKNSQILKITLPSYIQIYNVNHSNDLTSTPWLYANLPDYPIGYWTSTAYNEAPSTAWYVGKDGALSVSMFDDSTATQGIRPVITISKDSI